jgi:hypothetical protein
VSLTAAAWPPGVVERSHLDCRKPVHRSFHFNRVIDRHCSGGPIAENRWRRFLRFTRITRLALQRGVRQAALAKIVQGVDPALPPASNSRNLREKLQKSNGATVNSLEPISKLLGGVDRL